MINYAEEIKEYRERKFLTQVELAKILGVGKVAISRWEQGHHQPTIKMKKRLYALFVEAGMKIED